MSHWSYASFFYRTNCIRFASSIFRPLDVTLELCTIRFRIFRVVINRQMSRWSYALFGFVYFVLYQISVEYFSSRNKSTARCRIGVMRLFSTERIVLDLRRVFFDRQMSRWSYALFGFIYFVLYQICVEYFSNRNKSTARCRVGVMHYSVSYISSRNRSTARCRVGVMHYLVSYISSRNKSPDIALELCTIRFCIFRIILDLRRVFFES